MLRSHLIGNQFRKGLRPSNAFPIGHPPWNKGKYVHLSPATEFKSGPRPELRAPAGTVSIRIDKNDKPRAFVKVSDPNIWKLRAVIVWESVHGPLPKGLLVHHCDRDTLNDSADNLESKTRAQHLMEHRHELEEARLAGLRRAAEARSNKAELRESAID
jgi:hypothetical protein